MDLNDRLPTRMVSDVVSRAFAAGLSPVLIAVLADAEEPLVARQRAYGRLTAALDHRPPSDVRRPAA